MTNNPDDILSLAYDVMLKMQEETVSEELVKMTVDLMNDLAFIIQDDKKLMDQAQETLLKSAEAIQILLQLTRDLQIENQQLILFINAVKDFPVFQC